MKIIIFAISVALFVCLTEAHIGVGTDGNGTYTASVALPQFGGKCIKPNNTNEQFTYDLKWFCNDSDGSDDNDGYGTPGFVGSLMNYFGSERHNYGATGDLSFTADFGDLFGNIGRFFPSGERGPLAPIFNLFCGGKGGGMMGGVDSGIMKLINSGDKYPLGGLLRLISGGGGKGGGMMGGFGSGVKSIMDLIRSEGNNPFKGILDLISRGGGKGRGMMDGFGSGLDGILKLFDSKGNNPFKGILDLISRGGGKGGGMMGGHGSGGNGIMDLIKSVGKNPLDGILNLISRGGGKGGGMMGGLGSGVKSILNGLTSGLAGKLLELINKILGPVFGILSGVTSNFISPKLIYALTSGLFGSKTYTPPSGGIISLFDTLPKVSIKVKAGGKGGGKAGGKYGGNFGGKIGGNFGGKGGGNFGGKVGGKAGEGKAEASASFEAGI